MADAPKHGEFCWNELMTLDVKKAKEFYGALFGWTSQDQAVGDMTYTMLMMGDKPIGGMLRTPHDKEGIVPPHWMSYVLVENVDATVKKAESLGAVIRVPTMPVGDMGRFAVFQDPTGATIAVWEPTKSK